MPLLALTMLLATDPPAGWWIVEASNGLDVGLPGAAWQFFPDTVAVDAARTGLRKTPQRCTSTSAKSWRCERTLTNGIHILELRLDRSGALSASLRREKSMDTYGAFNARKATAEEAKQLDRFAAEQIEPDLASCAAAKRCYALACPRFGDPHDPCVFEQQSMSHDGPSCRAYIPMLIATLKQLGADVPPECSAP